MDRFNVIDITTDLDELNQDMYKWSSMPYERRLRSDDECRRRYGISNITLYNRLKAAILSAKTLEDPEYIGNAISEGFTVDDPLDDSYYAFLEDKWRMEMAMQLNESPVIAIVYNPTYIFSKEEAMEVVNDLYTKYSLLSEKNKRFSNAYSMDLFGYNVPNMYEIVSNKLTTDIDASKHDKLVCVGESINPLMTPVKESVDQMIVHDDKIGLLRVKLDSCAENIKPADRAYYKRLNETINENLYCDYEDVINKYSPIRVPANGIISCHDIPANSITNENYYSILKEKVDKFNSTTDKEEKAILEQDILDLGWNPVLPVSNMSFSVARHHMNLYLKEHAPIIVDLTKFKVSSTVLTESTATMRKKFNEYDLHPVYIVLSYTGTVMGKIIRAVKGSMFTHSGISLDSDLKTILTFNFNGNKNKGFVVDSLQKYESVTPKALISVLCVFVNHNTMKKLKANIRYFESIKDKTKYNFGNLFNILFNKEKANDPANSSLVCSQFVDTLLKLSGVDLTDKSSNLVIPQDFQNISNPKLFKLYEGLAKEYNEIEVENLINQLFVSRDRNYILYSKLINQLEESCTVSDFRYYTENEEANKVLDEINKLLTPTALIQERKSIIKITDDGNVSIQLMKDLEREYQEAHRLLTTYSSDNLEGIKHELARLFHVINICEKKIKKMKKDDSKYKDMINLRARCMNDFKKYLKIVLEKEPTFDFTKYYTDSEYDDSTIEIDRKLIDLIGELVGKIFRKDKKK